MQLSEYEQKCLSKLGESMQSGKWSNDALVQLIEQAAGFLNLQTIPDYCKRTGISYNGAKKFRTIRKIIGVKFVIDNE